MGTASTAGLFGNPGQANYATAKIGLVGFAQTLGKEGKKHNIHSNAIAPYAGTRMTETVSKPEVLEAMDPRHVVPMTLYLCHESCTATGETFEAGAGVFLRVQIARAKGWVTDPTEGTFKSLEDVAANFEQIRSMEGAETPDIMTGVNKNPVFTNVSKITKLIRARQSKL